MRFRTISFDATCLMLGLVLSVASCRGGNAAEAAPVPVAAPVAVLQGETNKPELSVFGVNEPVTLTFTATGLQPGQQGLSLQLRFADAHEATVAERTLPVVADAGGRWSGTLDAPQAQLGFYRVYAQLSNGVTIPGRQKPSDYFSRPAGFITYAIVPDPATRQEYPASETFFGMQGGYNDKVNVLPYLGIRWVMGPYGNWGALCPEQPEQFPQLREKAAKEGKVYPDAGYRWPVVKAADGTLKPWKIYRWFTSVSGASAKWKVNPYEATTFWHGTGKLTPAGAEQFAAYCRSMARAAAEDYPEQPRYYEVTWEPCYPWGFKGTDEDLVRIYEVAYKALHGGDAKAIVTGPCAASIERMDWYSSLQQKGLFRYLDALSLHPYIGLPPEQNDLRGRIVTMRNWMRQTLGRELPVCGTEQGFTTREEKSKELLQAQGLVRANLIQLGEGWALNMAFYAVDFGNQTTVECGYGFHYNLSADREFGTPKWGPKPVSPAYAAMTWLLEGHRATGIVDWLGGGAQGYVYERGDDMVVALWDWMEPGADESAREVTLAAGVPAVTVYDWMGNAREVRTEQGTLRLRLTPDPVYVKGLSPRLWGARAVRPVQATQKVIEAFPGRRVEVAVAVEANLGGALSGVVTAEADARLGCARQEKPVALAADQKTELHFAFDLLATAAVGDYPLSLTLAQGQEMKGGSVAVLRVREPLTIGALRPMVTAEGRSLQLPVQEREQSAVEGMAAVRLEGVPESAREQSFALTAGQEATLRFAFGADLDVSPLRLYDAKLEVKTKKGYRFKQAQQVNFTVAPRMQKAPVIDGNLEDWRGVAGGEIKGAEWLVENPQQYRGSEDLQATVRYAWDEACLYFSCEVRDDAFYQPHQGWATWQADCLQLAFDPDFGKKIVLTGNELVDKDLRRRHTEVDLALTPAGPEAFRTFSFSREKLADNVLLKPEELTLAVRREARLEGGVRVVYEAAIPWRSLGMERAPEAGALLGVAGTVNDKDTDDKTNAMRMGWFDLKNPERFGGLLLGPELVKP